MRCDIMIDRKRPRLASSRVLWTPSAKPSWLSLSLFANPVPTRDDTPASRKRVFRETRRFAAFYFVRKLEFRIQKRTACRRLRFSKAAPRARAQPTAQASRRAQTGERTRTRATGVDETRTRCSARRTCPRAIDAPPTLGALGIARASIRSVVVTRAGVFPDRDRVSTLRLSSAIRSSAARIATPRTRRAVTSRSRPRGTSGVSRS